MTEIDLSSHEPDAEGLRSRIQKWLLAEGWRLREKQHEDAAWLVDGEDGAGRHIVVGQKKGVPDQVLIQGAVLLSDQHRQQFETLAPAERQDLLWDLRFRLLGLGVEFSGVQDPLQTVNVSQRIYSDGLTKDRFLQRASRVRNGILAVLWTISRRFSQWPGSEGGELGVN